MKNVSDFCIAVVLILQMIGSSNLLIVLMRTGYVMTHIRYYDISRIKLSQHLHRRK